jgi:hypothetical protein
MPKWITQYSESFGIALSEHPEIATMYTEDKEKALQIMKLYIYGDTEESEHSHVAVL